MDPSAVAALDNEGKAPIHYLCQNFNSSSSYLASAEEYMFQSLVAFLEVDPSIVTIEDEFDSTALEYAITANAPYKIIRYLQKATERYWKECHGQVTISSPDYDIRLSRRSDDEPSRDNSQSINSSHSNDGRSESGNLPEHNSQRVSPAKKPSRSKYAMTA